MPAAYTVHGANSNAQQRHAFEADVARCLDTMGGFAPNQGGTVVAATLQGGGRRGHRVDAEGAAGGHLVPAAPSPSREVIACDTSREGEGADSDATSGLIAVPVAFRGREEGSQIEAGEPGDPAFTLRTPGGGSSFPMVAHTLTGEGFDASEDGTGRSIPIVPTGMPPTIAMAFNWQTGGDGRLGYGDKPTALQASQVTAVALSENQRGEIRETPYSRQITTGGGKPGQGYPAVREGMAVRRLTPLETERLQGFPDEWTKWLADGTEQSDSARYRQCGNAVAVPVVEWIARRLVAADQAITVTNGEAVA